MAKRPYKVWICGDVDCPTDPAFVHESYFGCVPRDFNDRTGRSKTHRQVECDDGKWRWAGGGCDPAPVPTDPAPVPTDGAYRWRDDGFKGY